MGISIHRDRQGPDWPLGNIALVTPGTPVSIMSVVDPTLQNDPNTATPGAASADEYTVRAQQIIFHAVKAGAGPPLLANTNTGFIYIVRKATAGNGGTADTGVVIKALAPGETFILSSSALVKDVFNPYRYFIDGDTGTNGCQVTLIIQ